MQGKKKYQEKLFLNFQLSSAVPEDNFYRRLNQIIDFSFLYKATNKYYGSEGQRSIDPVVFMKLMLVGYLENCNSDRRIIAISKLRLDILLFIGYDIDEELPWHSTLSRTRQLYGEEVFMDLFKLVLKQCIDKGMVSGKRQAVDGVFVKANASLDNMISNDILADAETYGKELEENDQGEKTVIKLETPPNSTQKQKPANKTHYNRNDPEAKLSVKPGKATALNYLGQVSVDTFCHTITHIQAFTADLRDSDCLSEVVQHLKDNFQGTGLEVEEIIADTGYSSGKALQYLEDNNIKGYIPNHSQFVYRRDGFTYSKEGDYYECINNKHLTYRGTYLAGKYYNKEYRIDRGECKTCPFKETCSAYGKHASRITDTVDRPYYERMHLRMKSPEARTIMRQRQSTVEPVIGTLVNFLGMKRVNTIGRSQANKCVTMAAIAYNLKKLLKHSSERANDRLKHAIPCPITRYTLFFKLLVRSNQTTI
ncbi:IS1182 family transposase [Daejeonella lutea]|uniref:Transposase n=6 Tax=Daejeonella lutea TaxID=572036 RepID=A0A1T5FFU4_9SPHI|nr:IS1182 family transposase [Daejeonella lutea]SKB95050.1 Transposase [Daejeonella lutea]